MFTLKYVNTQWTNLAGAKSLRIETEYNGIPVTLTLRQDGYMVIHSPVEIKVDHFNAINRVMLQVKDPKHEPRNQTS